MSNKNNKAILLEDGDVKLHYSPDTESGYIQRGSETLTLDKDTIDRIGSLMTYLYIEQGLDNEEYRLAATDFQNDNWDGAEEYLASEVDF